MYSFGLVCILTVSFISGNAYNPDADNVYHLFTRDNRFLSQPLLPGNEHLVETSNFNPGRRTIYLIHGFVDSVSGIFNKVMIEALLEASNVNVIAVDWGTGAYASIEEVGYNSVISGQAGARFINWFNSLTGASAEDYHIIGHSLGAHQAAVLARNIEGNVVYVTALDPANTLINSEHFFSPDCAIYTEAIHTAAEMAGYGFPLAHVDFYPNGGTDMPRCEDPDDRYCQHASCYYYMAESLETQRVGQECATYEDARSHNCNLPGRLKMGGLAPKIGSRGIFYVNMNNASTLSSSLILMFITSFNCVKNIAYL